VSLRDKTLFTVGLTILVVIAVIFAISQIVLLSSFIRLEEQYTRQSVDRVLFAIEDRLSSLDMLANGWSARDQTYEFVQSGNLALVDEKWGDETFQAANLDTILIVNEFGEQVYSKAFDRLAGREVPVGTDFLEHFSPGSDLLEHNTVRSRHKGILLLDEKPMLVVARPIVTSRFEGPIGGTFVFGRYLSDEEIDFVSESYAADVTFHRLDGSDLSTVSQWVTG
jgi:sensor domain CHASE-containing protein